MENIKGNLVDGVYELEFAGHIDSTNAGAVEEAINGLKPKFDGKDIVINAEHLEYISSAGLRVILRLLKEHPSLKIINVSNEVYDVFQMTGFTEMLPVEKAFREVSVEGCEVIGQGANGAVYRIDPEIIIKVYNNKDALPDIKRETDLARKAFVLGIPTAIPFDVVKVNHGYGSVFELLNAKSFSKILNDNPEKMDECVKMYVDLLKKIHSTHVKKGDMPDMKAVALNWAKFLKDYIPSDKYEKLLNLVQNVPERDTMIHGDYHTKNVMLQNGEILLIDMDTLSMGHPIFELASMFLGFIGFAEVTPENSVKFLGISRPIAIEFFSKAMAQYLGINDQKKIDEVLDKARVIGYTRVIRRSIRRHALDTAEGRAGVEHYTNELLPLLDKVDSLDF